MEKELAEAVLKWAKYDKIVAEDEGWSGYGLDDDGDECPIDELWDEAKENMVKLARKILKI